MPTTPGFGGGAPTGEGSSGSRSAPGFGGGSSSSSSSSSSSAAPAKKKRNLLGRIVDVNKGTVKGVFNVLDRPSQAVKGLIKDSRDNAGSVDTFKHLGSALAGHGKLTAQEALGTHLKGPAGVALNLAGDVALDPTTYLSFGTSAAAKVGLKHVVESAGKDVAEEVVKRGAKKVLQGDLRTRVAEHIAAQEGGSTKAADKILTALDRNARGGVKVVGRTVIPSARIPGVEGAASIGRRLKEAAPIAAITPRSGIARSLGQQTADDVGAAAARARASAGNTTVDFVDRLVRSAKDAGVTRAELEHVVGPALDIGGDAIVVPDHLKPFVDEMRAVRKEVTAHQVEHGLLQGEAEHRATMAAKASAPFDAELDRTRTLYDATAARAERARTEANALRDQVKAGPDAIKMGGVPTKPAEAAAIRVQKAAERLKAATARTAGATDRVALREQQALRSALRGEVLDYRRTLAAAVKGEARDLQSGWPIEDLLASTPKWLDRRAKIAHPNIDLAEHLKQGIGPHALMKFSGGKGQGLPPHVWLERWNAARNVVPHVAGAEDYTRIADDVISYVKAVNEAKSAGHGIISAGAGARALHLSGGDPQAELYLTGSVKDAVAAIEASGVQAPTAGIVARMRERATRAAAGDAVPNLTGAEKRMVAEIRATENAGVAGDKLTAARDATVGRIAERGRKVGAAEGEKLGKAEQRARVLENILRSSEARGPRLVAKRESAIKDAMGKVINPEEYMPRIFTKEGRAALARAPEIASRHGMAPSELKAMIEQGGHLRERTLMRNAPAAEVEKVVGGQLRAAGALKGNMLEHDALQLMGKRAALGEKAVGEAKYLQDLTKLKTPAGERILMHEAEGAAPAGWATVDAGPLGKFHAPLEVAKEINQVRDVIVNDEALKEFHGLLGKLNTLWKGYATVPLVGGAGFHARNAQGNVWLNFLAGVKNPVDYARATKLQMAVRRAGGDVSKLSLKDRTLIDLAKKHGVIDEGFFLTDLGERSGKLGRAAKGQKLANVGRAINPLSTDNVVIRSGRSVGSAVENNARLAHFIAKLGELGSADEAARSVRKYLFDYGDLTPTERSLKKVVAFWTFMRKNAPLQAAEFARQPGKFAALAHGRDAAFGEFGNDTSLDQIPAWLDYAKKRGDVPMKFAGHTFLVSPDLPATSAINTVEPDLAGLYGRFGGFLPSLAKLGAETITQRSLFTGAPVKGSGLKQGLEALLPLFGKIESSPYYAELSKDPQKLARLLSSLTGLNVRDISNEEGKPQVGDVADQIPFTAGAQR